MPMWPGGGGFLRGLVTYGIVLACFLASTHITKYYYPQGEAVAPKNVTTTADDESPVFIAQPLVKLPSNVTLTFHNPRADRMGSRIQLPLSAWIVARYYGWNFCSPNDHMTVKLSMPICFGAYDPLGLLEGPRKEYYDENSVKAGGAGVYYVNINRNTLWGSIQNHESGNPNRTMLDDGFKKEWRERILGATLRPDLEKELWLSKDSVKIAVHARRGDILPGKRNDAWISDNQLIGLIEVSMWHIRRNLGNDTKIEVHMFSESYGATDWKRYGTLVDKFHLAPFGSGDIDLNMRDWKHFLKADVTIVGGSFSRMPAYARPGPSKETGLPLTLNWNGNTRTWSCWRYVQRTYGIMAIPIPGSQQVIAKTAVHKDSDRSTFTEILPINSIIGNIYGYGYKKRR